MWDRPALRPGPGPRDTPDPSPPRYRPCVVEGRAGVRAGSARRPRTVPRRGRTTGTTSGESDPPPVQWLPLRFTVPRRSHRRRVARQYHESRDGSAVASDCLIAPSTMRLINSLDPGTATAYFHQPRFFASSVSQSTMVSIFSRHTAGPHAFILAIRSLQPHSRVGPSPTHFRMARWR